MLDWRNKIRVSVSNYETPNSESLSKKLKAWFSEQITNVTDKERALRAFSGIYLPQNYNTIL